MYIDTKTELIGIFSSKENYELCFRCMDKYMYGDMYMDMKKKLIGSLRQKRNMSFAFNCIDIDGHVYRYMYRDINKADRSLFVKKEL